MKSNNYLPLPDAKITDYCCFVWHNERDKYDTQNIQYYYEQLFKVKNIKVDTLGKVDVDSIYIVNTVDQDLNKPDLLIIGGVHGEEPAGAWGLLQFIKKLDSDYLSLIDRVNLHFVPILNSYGFKLGYRLNKKGLSVNSGYFDDQADIQTDEGNIIKKNLFLLAKYAKDGFMNLHENIEANYSYIYCIENTKVIPDICHKILDISSDAFGKHPDGKVYDGNLKDGIDFNTHDETLDDYMVRVGSIKRSITTELPGQKDIVKRIDAYEKMIYQFIISSLNDMK